MKTIMERWRYKCEAFRDPFTRAAGLAEHFWRPGNRLGL